MEIGEKIAEFMIANWLALGFVVIAVAAHWQIKSQINGIIGRMDARAEERARNPNLATSTTISAPLFGIEK